MDCKCINNTIYKNQTVAFADGIKDILSRLFGINRDCFDNRIYKDELYYHLKTRQFITVQTVEKEHVSVVHSQMISTITGLNRYIDTNACIKLRTLMQWFGTEIVVIKFMTKFGLMILFVELMIYEIDISIVLLVI